MRQCRRCLGRTPQLWSWRAALSVVGVLLFARSANAELPPIEWHAPPGCGTAKELRLGVARLLRADPSDVAHERFVALVEEGSPGHWRLELRGTARSGTWIRTLTGDNCVELYDATKVLIALAIAPSHAAAIIEQSGVVAPVNRDAGNPPSPAPTAVSAMPAPNEDTTRDPVAGSTSAQSVTNAIVPSTRNSDFTTPPRPTKAAATARTAAITSDPKPDPSVPASGTALLARAGIAAGILPSPTPLLALGVMHGIEHVQMAGYLGWLPPVTAYRKDDPNKGARVQLGLATVELGYAWLEQPLEFQVHASLQGGLMLATSRGIVDGRSGMGPYGAAGVGCALVYPQSSRWAGVLSADGWVNFLSPEFTLSELGRVYEPGNFGGALALAVRARLK